MVPSTTDAWLGANQRHLSLAIAEVRALLVSHAARATASPDVADAGSVEGLRDERDAIARGLTPIPALDSLCRAFGLTDFERQVLMLCAGSELDADIGSLCGLALGDPQRGYPTFGLALAAFPGAHWSALLPESALRRWRLIEYVAGGSPGAPITTRPLRIDERTLHLLTGLDRIDERLAVVAKPIVIEYDIVPTHRDIADRIVAAWTRHVGQVTAPVVALHGADLASARAIAACACQMHGWQPYVVSERAIPANQTELHLFVTLWEREARLGSAALVIETENGAAAAHREGMLRGLVDRLGGPIVVISREREEFGSRLAASFEIARPTADEQRVIWSRAIPSSWARSQSELRLLTSQFSLNVPEIQSAAEEALAQPDSRPSSRALWNACRHQSRGRLEDLAQRIISTALLEDLVLPESQKEILEDVVTHVRHSSTVHDVWGFGAKSGRGLGISALFAGASGTGKTMAAEVLAGALELDLYRVDLSAVVSKYIGETEKNLRRIFDAADVGGAILLFDEADALFGKRSEVKDSHDRYANIEVSYLLQRMESYRGLAILTTNLKSALDSAFLRRLRFIVQFPFPDVAQRAEIWRRAFPDNTPTAGLNVERLAQLSVAGGSIRNVALKAAFLAADTNEPVGMSHVLRAARSEYAKLEKPLTDAEVAGWM
jgi:AAA+ superfamily predicted ATPase